MYRPIYKLYALCVQLVDFLIVRSIISCFSNVVLEKDGKVQLDRPCEK